MAKDEGMTDIPDIETKANKIISEIYSEKQEE